jgi:hypothetical protein
MSEFKKICFAVLIASGLLWPAPSIAEEEIDPGTLVSVFGEADVPVYSGNFIRARKDAMNKALREAILNVVRMLLPPEDIPKEFRVQEPEDLPGELTELLDQLNTEEVPEGEGDIGEPSEEIPVIAEEKALNEFLTDEETVEPDGETEFGEPEEEEEETQEQILVREFVEERVLAHGLDFVQSYKFINEGVNEDETSYYMNVEFTFFISHLSNELTEGGLNVAGGQGPKVILLVDESAIGRIHGPSFLLLPSATEENLMAAIRTQGYDVVPREEVRKLGNNDRIELAMEGDLDAIHWLKSKFDAEYLILATATSKSFPMRGKRPAYVYGEIDAKIYRGETLELLWEKRIVKKLEGSSGTMSFQSVRMASEIFRKNVLDFLYNQEVP